MPRLGQEAHCLRGPQLCKHGFVNCCIKSARSRPVPFHPHTAHQQAWAPLQRNRTRQQRLRCAVSVHVPLPPAETCAPAGTRRACARPGGVLTAERRNDHGRRTSHRRGRALWPCCPLAPPREVRLLQHRARPAPCVRVAVPPLRRHCRGRLPRIPCDRARLGCRSRKRVPVCATASMPQRVRTRVSFPAFTPPQRPSQVSSASCLVHFERE